MCSVFTLVSAVFGLFIGIQPAAAYYKSWTYTSYYVEYVGSNWQSYYQYLGCAQAAAQAPHTVDSEVILDFGAQDNTTQVKLVDQVTISVNTAESIAKNYILGFKNCDSQSNFVTVLVGVNNDGTDVGSSTGNLWGYVGTHVADYAYGLGDGNILVSAASDFENWDGGPHTTGAVAKNWISGFNSHNPDGLDIVDFGAADGCPLTTHTNANCDPSGHWNQDDHYYVSWLNGNSYAVPQIYRTDGEQMQEWEQISLWGVYNHSTGKIQFDSPLDTYPLDHSTNTAGQAFTQMQSQTNADSHTVLSGIPFSDEITAAND